MVVELDDAAQMAKHYWCQFWEEMTGQTAEVKIDSKNGEPYLRHQYSPFLALTRAIFAPLYILGLIRDGSKRYRFSSMMTVRPLWLSDFQRSVSAVRPKTRKLHGAEQWRRASDINLVSAYDILSVMLEFAA